MRAAVAAVPASEQRAAPPFFAGKIGATLLCFYVLGVALRIDGCYGPEPAPRDELRDAGPHVGEPFPAFALADLSGARIALGDLGGAPSVIAVVPSLDWSPPSKARVVDLAQAFAGRADVRVAVLLAAAQATPRARAFVRERRTPFYYLVDDAGLIDRLGLAMKAPDESPAAHPATFVLDAGGVVRLRDVRTSPRTWLAGATVAEAAADLLRPSPPAERAP